jgi:hypothetical protein
MRDASASGDSHRRFGAGVTIQMASIPGKACGPCTMCCTALEIIEFTKPPGIPCVNCIASGGCAIYAARPPVCREFECLWLTERGLPPPMRPDRIGAILMEDEESGEYRAVCEPHRPNAWRAPRVFAHLVSVAKAGRVVVAKAGLNSWRVFASGETAPTV